MLWRLHDVSTVLIVENLQTSSTTPLSEWAYDFFPLVKNPYNVSVKVKYVTDETTATPKPPINHCLISLASNPSILRRDNAISIAGGIMNASVPWAFDGQQKAAVRER